MNTIEIGLANFYLRPVMKDDKERLLIWANDEVVRRNSFHQEFITEESHNQWFDRVIKDPNVLIFILMMNEEAIGQCRLTIEDGIADIAYSIDKKLRGKGMGKILIHLMEQEVVSRYPEVKRLTGKVKESNIPSIKCFKDSGYKESYQVFEKEIDKGQVN